MISVATRDGAVGRLNALQSGITRFLLPESNRHRRLQRVREIWRAQDIIIEIGYSEIARFRQRPSRRPECPISPPTTA